MGGLPTCPPNSDTVEDDDDLYDCVEAEGDDGDDIYEDLMRVEVPPSAVSAAPTNPGCGVPICGVAVSPPPPPPKAAGFPLSRPAGGSHHLVERAGMAAVDLIFVLFFRYSLYIYINIYIH